MPYGFDFAKPVSRFEEVAQGHQAAVGERRPGRFRGRVLPPRSTRGWTPSSTTASCPPIWIGAARSAHAGHHRPLRRRLVAGGRLDAGGLRRQAQGRPRGRRAGGPRSDGDRPGDHSDLPDRRRGRARRDARGAAGQVDPADAHRRGSAQLRLRASDGPDLARLSGHRSRHADARADHRVLREGRHAGDPRHASRAARRSRSREKLKGFCDAGMRVFKLLDYGGMAGSSSAPIRPPRCARPRTNCCALVEGS